ncbi:MAG: exosortase F system-associated protein [candidate division WOR-3 bacterium]
MISDKSGRYFTVLVALFGLLAVYLLQQVNIAGYVGSTSEFGAFVLNRTVRFIINDLLVILMIYAIFQQKKYVWFAFAVQLFGLFAILIPYFVIKYHYPHYNGPLLSFLHRLVVNPLLMLLLIPALYLKHYSGIKIN